MVTVLQVVSSNTEGFTDGITFSTANVGLESDFSFLSLTITL